MQNSLKPRVVSGLFRLTTWGSTNFYLDISLSAQLILHCENHRIFFLCLTTYPVNFSVRKFFGVLKTGRLRNGTGNKADNGEKKAMRPEQIRNSPPATPRTEIEWNFRSAFNKRLPRATTAPPMGNSAKIRARVCKGGKGSGGPPTLQLLVMDLLPCFVQVSSTHPGEPSAMLCPSPHKLATPQE